ncbi:MAG: hypothetical protein GY808_18150, partial [Gammaproteobacteria bacterium]|nr:hypothetical protein [Gammaproteobacteria bacterium]
MVIGGPGISWLTILDGRYTLGYERTHTDTTETGKMLGFGYHAHEFGHLIGFTDLYGNPVINDSCKGVGYFSIMGAVDVVTTPYLIPHVDPWHKLRIGWLDHDIVTIDTTNYALLPVSDTTITQLPEVGILNHSDNPANNNWNFVNKDYHILENRSAIGFDRHLNYNNRSFLGGMVIWHVAYEQFNNLEPLLIVEADNDWALITGQNNGSPSDFFPGTMNVTSIDDTTNPDLKMKNGEISHYGLYNIEYNVSNNEVQIGNIQTNNNRMLITQDETWQDSVIIDHDVIITDQAKLTLQSGTIVFIDPAIGDKVSIEFKEGSQLVSNGTKENPVEFKHVNSAHNNEWYGLSFQDGSSLDLSYTSISNAGIAINFGSQHLINQQFIGLTLDNCENGIVFESGKNIQFDDCYFNNTTTNLSRMNDSSVVINSIYNNDSYLIAHKSSIWIENNQFYQGSYIRVSSDTSVIKNNLFTNYNLNTGFGIFMISNYPSYTQIINNIFAYYLYGIRCLGGNYNPTIKNNIFYQNSLTGSIPGDVKYNDFYNLNNTGAPINTNGNIDGDPLFIDPTNGDYTLEFFSPCIDTGDINDDFSNEPFPNGGRINMGHHGNTALATESFDIV